MSVETLEDLKAIIAGKPEGASHIDDIATYWKVVSEFDYYFYNGSQWDDSEPLENGTRSLSDIERIIELMELNQNMHTTVAGYLWGKDWAHWNEFNAGKFKL